MNQSKFISFKNTRNFSDEEMLKRSKEFYEIMKQRRTIREFSDKPVSREVIENCIATAGTAPNGANMQPWHFVVVGDNDMKKKIREAAEEEEKIFYTGRAPK